MNRRGFMQTLLAGGGFTLADKLWVPKKSYFFLGGERRVDQYRIFKGGVLFTSTALSPPVWIRTGDILNISCRVRKGKLFITNHSKKAVAVKVHISRGEEL